MAVFRKQLTPEQALQKLKHYCAYQERSHSEVRDKLFTLGVWKKDHDAIIATLIEENYLNEERFAIAFAGGKFRMKQWGRVRIKYELKQRQVSDYSIRKSLRQIEESVYLQTLQQLAASKYASLKGDQYLVRKKKTSDYLIQKGYEPDLVNAAIAALTKTKKETKE
ncbi:MAG: regulatory protein RecX [Chitinophagaceae bacterium]